MACMCDSLKVEMKTSGSFELYTQRIQLWVLLGLTAFRGFTQGSLHISNEMESGEVILVPGVSTCLSHIEK